MKAFRIFGMALIAIVLSVSLSSCSQDSDSVMGEDEVDLNEKKLTRIVSHSSQFDRTWTFTYNAKGLLIESSYESTQWKFHHQYTWIDNLIVVNGSPDYAFGVNNYTIILENGLVQKEYCSSFEFPYTYNSSNKLIENHGPFNMTYRDAPETFVWDSDKLMSISYTPYNSRYDTYTFKYREDLCKKGYFPLWPAISLFYSDELCMAHPEIMGVRTKQLPTGLICLNENGYCYSSSYTYEYDQDGYISKITETYEDGDIIDYILTWK